MDFESPHYELFVHIRIIVGMVLALSIARLLTGLARFIQHPSRELVYPVHLAWAFSMLLFIIHFWWWEYRLSELVQWSFPVYFLIILYAVVLFLLCTLLFPDRLEDYSSFKDYLMSRRRWFFGLLALAFVLDGIDTIIKGATYFESLGIEYPLRVAAYIGVCVVAMVTSNQRFHAAFVAASLIYQCSWILRLYATLP